MRTGEIAMNSTYWAPFAAHNTRTVQVKRSTPILCNLIRLILNLFHQIAQELLMGLMTSHSQKVDLNMAPGTKHCESHSFSSCKKFRFPPDLCNVDTH